jgi:hypothetical protein
MSPGQQASEYPPDESTREAAERGRTLKLLSEHSASAPKPAVAAPAAPAEAPGPEISVRPLHSDAARRMEFPDYSEPAPAPPVVETETAERAAAPAPAPSAVPSAEPAHLGASEPAVVPELTSPEPVATSPAVAARAQSWQAVLQATGTADGW